MTSAVVILALLECLEDYGISPLEIEKGTGIPKGKTKDPDIRISLDQLLELWRFAVRVTGDPALGIHLREKYGKNVMHFVVCIAMNATNAQEALEHWSRYAALLCPADQVILKEIDGRLILTYENVSVQHENIWMPEHYLSLVVYYGRMLAGDSFSPMVVHFRHANPADTETYQHFFQCPVFFKQENNALFFKPEDALIPMTTRNPHLHAVLEKHAEMLMKQLPQENQLIKNVQDMITRYLPEGALNIGLISRKLNMSRSTLYRKLKEQGTTFVQLTNTVRRELAIIYLKEGMNLTEITYLLGYADPSAFQHAFKRWYGRNPGQYRRMLFQ